MIKTAAHFILSWFFVFLPIALVLWFWSHWVALAAMILGLILWSWTWSRSDRYLIKKLKAKIVEPTSALGVAFARALPKEEHARIYKISEVQAIQGLLLDRNGRWIFVISDGLEYQLTETKLIHIASIAIHRLSEKHVRHFQWKLAQQVRIRSLLDRFQGFPRWWFSWVLQPFDKIFQFEIKSPESEVLRELRDFLTQTRSNHLFPIDIYGRITSHGK